VLVFVLQTQILAFGGCKGTELQIEILIVCYQIAKLCILCRNKRAPVSLRASQAKRNATAIHLTYQSCSAKTSTCSTTQRNATQRNATQRNATHARVSMVVSAATVAGSNHKPAGFLDLAQPSDVNDGRLRANVTSDIAVSYADNVSTTACWLARNATSRGVPCGPDSVISDPYYTHVIQPQSQYITWLVPI
jgi:hypothetical protein